LKNELLFHFINDPHDTTKSNSILKISHILEGFQLELNNDPFFNITSTQIDFLIPKFLETIEVFLFSFFIFQIRINLFFLQKKKESIFFKCFHYFTNFHSYTNFYSSTFIVPISKNERTVKIIFISLFYLLS